MNLALRGVDADLGDRAEDVFHADHLPDLRADYVLANPPFNSDGWYSAALRDDARWMYGLPPKGNANFAWVQHIIHHLAPTGVAAFVLANGSLSARHPRESEIRRGIVEASLVDCIVALPAKLFLNTAIPACLWIVNKDRAQRGSRQQRGEVLFIDARTSGRLETRAIRVLDDVDVASIVRTYHAWQGRTGSDDYRDVPGWCRSVEPEEVGDNGFVLTPGRYVGPPSGDEDEDVVTTLARLRHSLLEEIELGREIEDRVTSHLSELVS
jgi:type I restriction enzyme M protein